MAKTSKPDPQLEADVEFLGTLLAKGVSGLVEIGLTDGLKLHKALKNINASRANTQLAVRLFSRFFEINPKAAEAIELASAASPRLASLFEKLRMKPKPVSPEDVDVKDAEPC